MLSRIFIGIRRLLLQVVNGAKVLWRRYRALSKRNQIIVGIVVVGVVGGILFLIGSGTKPADETANTRTVTLEAVSSLSGAGTGASVIGTVRSITEAELLAQAGGAVTAVHTEVGATVPPGFVIAELENATEQASVLQAQGIYEGALASRSTQSGPEASTAAKNTYRSAFSTFDTSLKSYIDVFFGEQTAVGPILLINSNGDSTALSRERLALTNITNAWRDSIATIDSTDPATLLDTAYANTLRASNFIENLAKTASMTGSTATTAQLSSLATARANINTLLATISAARDSYRTRNTGATAGSDATVKQALGTLRLAQAAYEKKIIRAPIGGTVNFLPIRVGDYVNGLEHVATVAQNGALEIVSAISEENRAGLSVGSKVTVEGKYSGLVTSIAPALDPVTKQIEVRIAVTGTTELVNGQSVRLSLPNGALAPTTTAVATSTGPIMLPLATVKLTADSRVVFTIDSTNHLVALPVTIGDVRGDRIEITSSIPSDAKIVTDARGLSAGEHVNVAPAAL